MNPAAIQYQSYLLRLWKVRADSTPIWRASLESPMTGQREGFASVRDLILYLAEQCDEDLSALTEPFLAGDPLSAGVVHH